MQHYVQKPAKKMSISAKTALIAIPTAMIVLLIVIVVIGLQKASTQPTPEEAAASVRGMQLVDEDTHLVDYAGDDAPTLVEFLDFECESCAAAYPIIEQVRTQYDGRINYAIRYFPIPGHHNSMTSALAVEAAAQQGKFEEMYKKMFETQLEWGEKKESEAPRFREYAEALGLDMAAYDAAVADPATQERVAADFDAGVALGVQGTPTFFLDGQLFQPSTAQDITASLDAALAARE